MSNATIKQEITNASQGDVSHEQDPRKSLLIWNERMARLEELGAKTQFFDEVDETVQDMQSYTGPQMSVLEGAIDLAERCVDVVKAAKEKQIVDGSLVDKIVHQYDTEHWLSQKQLRVLERFLTR